MADGPTVSPSRVGRPRMRSRSANISRHIPIAIKPRAKSVQKTQAKDLNFSGKPEEDVEAHLLRTNDWMTIHDFPEDQKNGIQHIIKCHLQSRRVSILQNAYGNPKSGSKVKTTWGKFTWSKTPTPGQKGIMCGKRQMEEVMLRPERGNHSTR